MLCDNQQCSYSHWILHANYDIKNIHNGSKFSRNQDKRLFDKQKDVKSCPISRITINYAYPSPVTRDKNFKNKLKKKKTSQECILIPKDPTSPYAFTENVSAPNKPKKKKNKLLVNQDQACCVVIFFLVICTVSMVIVIIYLSQCTHAMTSGMT